MDIRLSRRVLTCTLGVLAFWGSIAWAEQWTGKDHELLDPKRAEMITNRWKVLLSNGDLQRLYKADSKVGTYIQLHRRKVDKIEVTETCLNFLPTGAQPAPATVEEFCKGQLVGDTGMVEAKANCRLDVETGDGMTASVPMVKVVTCPRKFCEIGALKTSDGNVLMISAEKCRKAHVGPEKRKAIAAVHRAAASAPSQGQTSTGGEAGSANQQ